MEIVATVGVATPGFSGANLTGTTSIPPGGSIKAAFVGGPTTQLPNGAFSIPNPAE